MQLLLQARQGQTRHDKLASHNAQFASVVHLIVSAMLESQLAAFSMSELYHAVQDQLMPNLHYKHTGVVKEEHKW